MNRWMDGWEGKDLGMGSYLSCEILNDLIEKKFRLLIDFRTRSHASPFPPGGTRFPFTANILAVIPAAKPSTWRAYCSTWRLFSRTSRRPGSAGSLNKRDHSSSGRRGCLARAREAFSDLRLSCQAAILACSRASWRW